MDEVRDSFRSSTWGWLRGTLAGIGTVLLGIAGVAVMRVLQLVGLAALLRRREHWPPLALFGLWIAFVLAVNGPIATPKYRLPIEPPLMVMTGAGLYTLSRWRHGAKPG